MEKLPSDGWVLTMKLARAAKCFDGLSKEQIQPALAYLEQHGIIDVSFKNGEKVYIFPKEFDTYVRLIGEARMGGQ